MPVIQWLPTSWPVTPRDKLLTQQSDPNLHEREKKQPFSSEGALSYIRLSAFRIKGSLQARRPVKDVSTFTQQHQRDVNKTPHSDSGGQTLATPILPQTLADTHRRAAIFHPAPWASGRSGGGRLAGLTPPHRPSNYGHLLGRPSLGAFQGPWLLP